MVVFETEIEKVLSVDTDTYLLKQKYHLYNSYSRIRSTNQIKHSLNASGRPDTGIMNHYMLCAGIASGVGTTLAQHTSTPHTVSSNKIQQIYAVSLVKVQ